MPPTVKELDSRVDAISKQVDSKNAELKAEIDALKQLCETKFAFYQSKIENMSTRIDLNESTISLQKTVIDNLKTEISNLREKAEGDSQSALDKIDDQKQYGMRPNLRINGVELPPKGVSESNEEVLKIVDEVCGELGAAVKPDDIFRAHRIGKKKVDENGRHHQAVIVRFRSWQARCALYRARPTRKKPRASAQPKPGESLPGRGFKSISLDLTPNRYDLLAKARSLIAENFPDNKDDAGKEKVFAYADINCNLCIRFDEKKVKFFSSVTELEELF